MDDSLKNFGDLLVVMVARNGLELTFGVCWAVAAVAFWQFAPAIFG